MLVPVLFWRDPCVGSCFILAEPLCWFLFYYADASVFISAWFQRVKRLQFYLLLSGLHICTLQLEKLPFLEHNILFYFRLTKVQFSPTMFLVIIFYSLYTDILHITQ